VLVDVLVEVDVDVDELLDVEVDVDWEVDVLLDEVDEEDDAVVDVDEDAEVEVEVLNDVVVWLVEVLPDLELEEEAVDVEDVAEEELLPELKMVEDVLDAVLEDSDVWEVEEDVLCWPSDRKSIVPTEARAIMPAMMIVRILLFESITPPGHFSCFAADADYFSSCSGDSETRARASALRGTSI